jgi:hypothetical protein
MEQAGFQAGVPTVAQVQAPTSLAFAADASVDAVVLLRKLGPLAPSARQACLSEAARVLRPGQPLVFIERLQEGASPLRPLIGGSGGALTAADLEALDGDGRLWSYVQYDVALQVGAGQAGAVPWSVLQWENRREGGGGGTPSLLQRCWAS